jgi:hypothetical protein
MNPSLENHSLAQRDAIGDQNDQGARTPAVGPLFSTIDPRLLTIDPVSSLLSTVDPALASRPQQGVGPLRSYVQVSEGQQGSGPPYGQQQGLYASLSLNDAFNAHPDSDPVWAAVNAQRLGPTLTIRGDWRQGEKRGEELTCIGL